MKAFKILLLAMAGLGLGACLPPQGTEPMAPPMNRLEANHYSDRLARTVDSLAGQLVRGLRPGRVKRVAVLAVEGPGGNLTGLGVYLSDKLTNRFVKSRVFGGVMERSRLNDVLVQQQIELSGHFDLKTVAPLGQKVGVDALVLGRLRNLGGGLMEVNLKLIDTKSAQVLSVAEARFDRTPLVSRLLARRLVARVTVMVLPAHARGSVTIGGQSRALRRGGVTFPAVRHGARVITVTAKGHHPRSRSIYVTGDVTLRLELKPQKARLVVRVLPTGAEATLNGRPLKLNKRGVASLEVLKGPHTITAASPGYVTLSRRIYVEADSRTVVLSLSKPEPAPAPPPVEEGPPHRPAPPAEIHQLLVRYRPFNARLRLDGQPLELLRPGLARGWVSPGRHRLVVQAPGYISERHLLEVDGELQVRIWLRPRRVWVPQPPAYPWSRPYGRY